MRWFLHWPIQPVIYSFVHSFTHRCMILYNDIPTHSFIHPLVYIFIQPFSNSCVHLAMQPFSQSCAQSAIRPFIHWSIHLSIHPSIHPFIHSSSIPPTHPFIHSINETNNRRTKKTTTQWRLEWHTCGSQNCSSRPFLSYGHLIVSNSFPCATRTGWYWVCVSLWHSSCCTGKFFVVLVHPSGTFGLSMVVIWCDFSRWESTTHPVPKPRIPSLDRPAFFCSGI